MHILMTGGTGFIGEHLLQALLNRGHQVTLLIRPTSNRARNSWPKTVDIIPVDIHDDSTYNEIPYDSYTGLAHLAWSDLDNYRSLAHMDTLLPGDMQFLRTMVERKIPRIFVTGTCFEYGLQEGCLSEEKPSAPILPYAMAKDFLRKYLQELQQIHPFHLQWGRLFYMHGTGQNPKSLLPSLAQAIKRGDSSFNMSGGEQLRDYLPVETLAEKIATVLESEQFDGIINICSGKPVSVKHIVREYIKKTKGSIQLNLGFHPYPNYEPMAYWGSNALFETISSQVPNS